MLAPGALLQERYSIKRLIAKGGMGAIYQAEDNRLGNVVAIKETFFAEAHLREQFGREATILANLRHPSLPSVTDYFAEENGLFLVMEYIPGDDLATLLRRHGKPFPIEQILDWADQLLDALDYMHNQRPPVIHRDIKPNNLKLTPRGQVILLDFGLAKDASQAKSIPGYTPYYAPLEQIRGIGTDPRSDLYSLAATIYELVTGYVPPDALGRIDCVLKDLLDPLRPASELNTEIPATVALTLNRALSLQTDQRPESAAAMRRALRGEGSLYSLEAPRSEASLARLERGEIATTSYLPVEAGGDNASTPTVIPNAAALARSDRFQEGVDSVYRGGDELSESILRTRIPTPLSPPSARPQELIRDRERRLSQSDPSVSAEPHSQHIPPTRPLPPTVSLGGRTIHLKSDLSAEQGAITVSTTAMLRHAEIYRHNEGHVFEELILHKEYEQLWRSLIHTGARNILTGYGPFGGTSLMQCAIAKAIEELKQGRQGKGALLVFYFRVTEETKATFKIEATNFEFGHLKMCDNADFDSNLNELRARANENEGVIGDPVMNFSLDSPLGGTAFFAPHTSGIDSVGTPNQEYDFSGFVADLNTFFSKRQANKSKALRQIVMRLINSKSLPSRVVLVIDRIKYLETIEALSKSELFSNKRIRVIAVARKEDYDSWDNINRRLRAIGFSEWYVPCIWAVDFDKSLFEAIRGWKSGSEAKYKIFLKHLEYIGQGSLGNIIAGLKDPRNITHEQDSSYINVDKLVSRSDIQHNAWVQDVLNLNWDVVFGDLFGGYDQDERTDRARIGAYLLIEWITKKRRFTIRDALKASRGLEVTISDDDELVVEVANNLLSVLTQNRYLSLKDDTYRVIWNRQEQPEPRKASPRQLRTRQRRNQGKEIIPQNAPEGHGEAPRSTVVLKKDKSPSDDQAGHTQRSKLSPEVASPDEAVGVESTKTIGSAMEMPRQPGASEIDSYDMRTSPTKRVAPPENIQQQPIKKVLKKVTTKIITEQTDVIIGEKIAMDHKVSLLIVFANPKDSDRLRLSEEGRTIRKCIERSKHRANLEYKIIEAARIKDLQRELIEGEYQVVHFSGHGAPLGQLAFEDENGETKLVPQQALANLLAEFPSIECVVLNSCYSVGQGRVIALGVPVVIAMSGPISDDAAQHFTRGFYDTIGAGKDYQFAYKMGCSAIELEGYPEESIPMCFEK